jgi:hypothetical protein
MSGKVVAHGQACEPNQVGSKLHLVQVVPDETPTDYDRRVEKLAKTQESLRATYGWPRIDRLQGDLHAVVALPLQKLLASELLYPLDEVETLMKTAEYMLGRHKTGF